MCRDLRSAFTPHAVIDGRYSVVGSDRRRIAMAIGNEHRVLPIQLKIANGTLSVVLDQQPMRSRFDVNLVAYLPAASTVIGRGENAGHTLNEFNVVRSFNPLGIWEGSAHTFSIPLSELPADASKVAVLIQETNQGAIVGASSINLR